MDRTAFACLARCSAAALALTLAAPGLAQTAYNHYSANKTEAILGGESRLAALVAQQNGQPIAVRPQMLSPAGYGMTRTYAARPVYRPAIAMDRPDVFGSVALPINRSSLDRRWRAVARGPVGTSSGAYAASLSGRGAIERLEAVNRYVNARVAFVDDIRQHRAADHWTSAAETLQRGKGDCEDYAIAKLQLLRRAGFAEKDLYLVILRDLMRRADHAVLVARADGRLLVLDNNTDRLIDSYELRDYRPIFTFSGDRVWTHGYRREVAPMVIASNPLPTTALSLASTGVGPIVPSTLR